MRKLLVHALLLGFTVLGACGGSSDSADSAPPARQSPRPSLDSRDVPADLRHLIPLAAQWGIGDDVERLAKVDSATAAERADLRRAVAPHQARITQWLNSFGQGLMSREATAFMYMQLAIEEMSGRP